jgi:hypothetical protein
LVSDGLGIKVDEPQPSIPPPKPAIDYSHEASEYEQKLIQVGPLNLQCNVDRAAMMLMMVVANTNNVMKMMMMMMMMRRRRRMTTMTTRTMTTATATMHDDCYNNNGEYMKIMHYRIV